MPPGNLERMWASGEISFNRLDPLRVGDEVEQTTTIDKVERKSGSRGTMCFVTQRKEIRRLASSKVTDAPPSVVELRTHVFRPPEPKASRAAAASASTSAASTTSAERGRADFEHLWTPDAVSLFRFSAITFNSHRIHYDSRYCLDVEGRPGLVVHGPLTAALLASLAHSHPPPTGPSHLARFSYRATSPLIVDREVRYSGAWAQDGKSAALRAESDHGKVSMTAIATYE